MLTGWRFAGRSFSFVWGNKGILAIVVLSFIAMLALPVSYLPLLGDAIRSSEAGLSFKVTSFSELNPQKIKALIMFASFSMAYSLLTIFSYVWISHYTWDSLKHKWSSLGRSFVGAEESLLSICLWSVLILLGNILMSFVDINSLIPLVSVPVAVAIFVVLVFLIFVSLMAFPIIAVERCNPLKVLFRSVNTVFFRFGDILLGELRIILTGFLMSLLIIPFIILSIAFPFAVFIAGGIIIFVVLMFTTAALYVFMTFIYYYERERRGLKVYEVLGLERYILREEA
ncbi:hypothetical protein ACFL42_02895 [Candidatus Omnitrophota bacterium]